MTIRLKRFFGPTAFRPLDVMESFQNSRGIVIDASEYLDPLPSFDYLSAFKKCEVLTLLLQPNTHVDFTTVPKTFRPKKVAISCLDRSSNLGSIKDLRTFETLDELVLRCPSGVLDVPVKLGTLRLRATASFNMSSLSHYNIRVFELCCPKTVTDYSFIQTFPYLQNFSLESSGMKEFPHLPQDFPLKRIVIDKALGLHQISSLQAVTALEGVYISGCPLLKYDELKGFRDHPGLKVLACNGASLIKKLKEVFPKHIEVIVERPVNM